MQLGLLVDLDVGGMTMPGLTVYVSDAGVTLLVPHRCRVGATLDVTNPETGVSAAFSVIWISLDDRLRRFPWRIGLHTAAEIRAPAAARAWAVTLWGAAYETACRQTGS